MKKLISISCVFMVMMFTFPFVYNRYSQDIPVMNTEKIEKEQDARKIKVLIKDEVVEMDIEKYLVGVLAAEMPASFENEALKAQAVAARTYTMYKKGIQYKDESHKGADVCDNFAHCKAYIDIENEKNNKWIANADIYYNKLKMSVDDTSGEIVTYKEKPIIAAFHSVSSEKTESAEDVWGSQTPYLVSVDSPGGELSEKFKDEFVFKIDDARDKLKSKYSDIILSDDAKLWFKDSKRSTAGGIINVQVGNKRLKGSEIRTIFKLNSTNFKVEFLDDNIIFKTTGYGHGVGMSQYGAQSMALDGKSYIEILKKYYKDTLIAKIF